MTTATLGFQESIDRRLPRKRRHFKLERNDGFDGPFQRRWTDAEVEVHQRAGRLRAASSRERHPSADVCRQLGQRATFYLWKKKYAHRGTSELRKWRSLEDENSRLKRLVTDLTLDKHMLAEALRREV